MVRCVEGQTPGPGLCVEGGTRIYESADVGYPVVDPVTRRTPFGVIDLIEIVRTFRVDGDKLDIRSVATDGGVLRGDRP